MSDMEKKEFRYYMTGRLFVWFVLIPVRIVMTLLLFVAMALVALVVSFGSVKHIYSTFDQISSLRITAEVKS